MADQAGYKGPNVPHRTSRKRAIEIGTNPAGFKGGVDYNAQAGTTAALAKGTYHDPAEAARVRPGGSQQLELPFTLGGGK